MDSKELEGGICGAASPLTVEIQQGQVSLLDISVPAGSTSLEYVNVTSTNATNPALLANLQTPFNQSAGAQHNALLPQLKTIISPAVLVCARSLVKRQGLSSDLD